jgi:outer membrane protein assembly factor BamB
MQINMGYLIIILTMLIIGSCSKSDPLYNETKEPQMGLLWSYDTEHSSAPKAEPVLENGSVFITGGLNLHKVSNDSGSRIWVTPIEGSASSLRNYRFIYNDSAIIGLQPNKIHGFNMENGNLTWTITFPDSIDMLELSMGARLGNYAYYNALNGYIIKADINTGMYEIYGKFPFYIRNINVFENGDLLIPFEDVHSEEPLSYTAVMGRWRPSTKAWVWQYKLNGQGAFSYDYPLIENNIVYTGLTSGFAAIDAETGSGIWRVYNQMRVSSFFALSDDAIFINAGYFAYALDRHTGNELWRTQELGPASSTRIHYKNGYVYWGHHNGIAIFDAKTGELVHAQRPEFGGYIWTSSMGPDRYFVQTSTHLLAYELYEPEEELIHIDRNSDQK